MTRLLTYSSVFLACLVALLMAVSCRGKEEMPEPEPVPAELAVKVVDSESKPVNSAEVLVGESYRGFTDSDGNLVLWNLKAGDYILTVKAHDYVDYVSEIKVSGKSSYHVTLSSTPPYFETDSLLFRTFFPRSKTQIHFRSNADWKVVSASPELTFNISEGHGNQQAVFVSWDFAVDSLVDVDTQEASFSVESAGKKLDFRIRLAVPIRITGTEGIVGNLVKDPSGVCKAVVSFSRKVKNVKAFLNYSFMDVEQIDDFTVTFPTRSNAQLFTTYRVDFITADSANDDGVSFKESDVEIPFNDKVVYLDGNTVGMELSRDESVIWTSVYGNKLRKIDSRSLEVLKEIDVPFQPGPLSFNPSNGMLYVIDSYTGDGKSVKVVDPVSGKLVKSIVIEPDEEDIFYNTTTISPWKIKFADNGVGAVLVSRSRLRMIDSRDGDKVSKHPYLYQEFDPFFEGFEHDIADVMLDNTGKRFILLDGLRVMILNTEDEGGEHFLLDGQLGGDEGGGTIWVFKPHPRKPLLYIVMPYCEGTYDIAAQTYTKPFSSIPGWTSKGDFCYGSPYGDDICTYLFNEGSGKFLMIQNHSTGEILYKANLFPYGNTEEFISFQDGDRVLIYENTLDKTLFIQLNTSRFW